MINGIPPPLGLGPGGLPHLRTHIKLTCALLLTEHTPFLLPFKAHFHHDNSPAHKSIDVDCHELQVTVYPAPLSF